MITMTQIRDGQAYMRNHLSANDYYSDSEKVIGHWQGKAAEMLGIGGQEVTSETFEALRTNRHPRTGERLTPRKPKVAYHDFVISAPKSVSIVAMVGGDERVVEAFDRCVAKALARLEDEACVRVRGGQAVHTESVRKTGNAVAAVYRHDTSRLLDPQLHSHLVFANVTWDHESERWLALQPKGMGEQSQAIRRDFYRDLASECRGLGYRTEPDGKAFRLREVERSLEKTFSQRAVQREQFQDRYEEVFGEKPGKKRVEQFIKDGKAAATRRFHEEYQARFSETPSQDLTQSFVRDWRSSKMSKAEPDQVKSIQWGRMTSGQARELSRLVAQRSNKAGPEQQSAADLTKGIRGKTTGRSQNRSIRTMSLGKKAMRIHSAMKGHPTTLMAIRLRQLARIKAYEAQRRTQ